METNSVLLAMNFFVTITTVILTVVMMVIWGLQQKRYEQQKRLLKQISSNQMSSANSRKRLLMDLRRSVGTLWSCMDAERGSVPGGTARAWADAVQGLHIFLLMRSGELPELADYVGRSSLTDDQIRKLIPWKRGIRSICESVATGGCTLKIDSAVSHEEYVLRDFPRILERIAAVEAADKGAPSPA